MKVRQALFVAVVAFLLAMLGASADADAQQPDLTSLSPAPASVLPCGDIDLSWASNADGHWVQVGSAPGASDYHIRYTTGADLGPVTSETLTNLPSDGSTIWVRIWTRTAAGWQTNPWFTYTACTQLAVASPAPASVLPCGDIDLSWASNADGHWVQVGSAPGASDYHIPYTTGADLGPVTSETLTNLPSDGSTIWVRIWTRTAAGWQTNPWFTYTACTADGCPVSATVLYDGESCYTLIAAPPGPERCPLPLLPEPTDPNLCRRPVELVPGG